MAALRALLRTEHLDAAFKELALTLPSETYIAEQLDSVDPQRIHAVREAMRLQLAIGLQADWHWAFEAHQNNGGYSPDSASAGRRAWQVWRSASFAWPRVKLATACGQAKPTSASKMPTT